MLTVEDYEKIRKAVLRDGMSQREAARTFGHGRDTIRKALDHAAPPGYRRNKEPESPLLDPVKHIIDAWLEDEKERGVPRKQRSNAKIIWQLLCKDHKFKGSVYLVRRYLRQKKRSAGGEAFYPLVFRPGEEGQVDWGDAWVLLAGLMVKVHLFCLRLCYSRATYIRAYLSEKMECFLDGHVQAFRFFGGVPRQCAYDNLKTAVVWVGVGRERRLNELFRTLCSHYLFDSRFCNIASGNEKGYVENLVKLGQSNFLAGAPYFNDLDELNRYLENCCREDLQRLAPHSEKTRQELFSEEKSALLPLQSDFEACIRRNTFATKQALVQHETNFYSVPVSKAYQSLLIKAFADRIEIWDNESCVSRHPRCWERHRHLLQYTHYIPLLETKPGGIINGRPFKGEPWGQDFERLRIELEYRYGDEGVRKFIRVLLLFSKYREHEVKAAVGECVRRRAFSDEAVMSTLNYRPPAKGKTLDLSRHPVLQIDTDGTRDAAEYDAALLNKEEQAS
ncbi:MAG: IS21 family transposase [Elusimicrobia bacterium]|nr:IS21 family transposase [Elusimicrobiota bacterium]